MAKIDLKDNEYLERFVSQDHIDSNDVQFWYQLLSCSFNFMRVQDPKVVDKTLDPYLVRLTLNNAQSLNIGSLVRVALDRVSRVKTQTGQSTNPYYVFQSFNALYLLRCICKSYIENISEEKLIHSFRAKVDTPAPMPITSTLNNVPQSQSNQPLIPQEQQHQSTQNQNQSADNSKPVSEKLTPVQTDINSPTPSVPESLLANQSQVPPSQVPATGLNGGPEHQTASKAEITSGSTMLDQFISTLIEIIVDIPLSDSTYLLQVESINALLVLLSTQMYSTVPASKSTIYRSLMQKKCSIHALILTKTLLNNFVRQDPVPQESGSIIIGLASGLWRVLTLGYGTPEEEEETETMPLLAKQSLLLLNILTNHYTNEKNPYREAIVSCQDSSFNLSDPQTAIHNANNDALTDAVTSKSALISNSIKIEFSQLYITICKNLNNDQVALLLYILLHSNKMFRPYILTTASQALGALVLPLLKILYSSIEKGSHHVYMVLILFIILSEEIAFNDAIHRITIYSVPWYKDRIFSEISLGSLTTLIIIRSFQYNTLRIKDKFLHTNLFATLANLSNHFDRLHPYVCQRLVELLERLSKRHAIITKPAMKKDIDNSKNLRNQTLEILNSNNALARALATDTQKQNLHDVSAIELDSTVTTSEGSGETQSIGAINISIPEYQQQSTVPDTSNNDNMKSVLPTVDEPGNGISDGMSQQSPNSNSSSEHMVVSMDDSQHDIGLIEEVIRMILEVLNNCLAIRLEDNPDLVYTLLYKRHVFGTVLSSHQSFYNMVINIERVLTFFYNKIESKSMSVEEIKELIQEASREWACSQTKDTSARLLFHYVEDEQPEEFFIPYIWTRIYYSSGIVWNPKRIILFNPEDL